MRHKYCATAVAVLMSGCTTMSGSRRDRPVLPSDIQNLVQCEAESAVRKVATTKPELKTWGGEYSVTLVVERRKGAGLTTLDWVIPHNSNPLFLGVGFGVTDRETATTVVNGSFRYSEQMKTYCRQYDADIPTFRGQLHLDDWLGSVIGNTEFIPTSVGRTLEFDVDVNSNLRPGFRITNLAATAGADIGHETTNTLVVGFRDKTPAPPEQVIIIGEKDQGVKTVGKRPGRRLESVPDQTSPLLDFLILNNQSRRDR